MSTVQRARPEEWKVVADRNHLESIFQCCHMLNQENENEAHACAVPSMSKGAESLSCCQFEHWHNCQKT